MNKISVIIPCYNHGEFLEDAVRSLLVQSYQNFEIIIVDDASTDLTLQYCTELMLLDKRVQAIRLDHNHGTAIANNVGMSISSGDYITIMSADDMRESLSLEKLLDTCIKNPHHFAYDDMRLYENGKRHARVWIFPEYDFHVLLYKNTIHTGIMFERRAYEETGGYPEEFSNGREDWAFNITLGMHGYCGVHVDYPGYIYRRGLQNRTLKNTTSEWNEYFKQKIRSRFSDLYAGRFPMACCGNRTPLTKVEGSLPLTNSSGRLVGAEGMTAVEYVGGNFGTTTYFGPVTGTGYKFDAGDNRLKMVDNRDLHTDKMTGLLDLRIHTKSQFVIAALQPMTEPEVAAEIKEMDVEIEKEVEASISVPVPLKDFVSPSSPNYVKLIEAGFADAESIIAEDIDTLNEKTGISKTALKAIKKMAELKNGSV